MRESRTEPTRIHRLFPTWTNDWIWGLLLIAVTLLIHAIGLVVIGLTLEQAGKALRSRNLSRTKTLTIVTFLIGASGGMLAALHGLEAAIWAITYVLLHAVGSLSDALLYSVNSMTTRGASDVVLQHHWKMLGALEAASGMLAFGLSTAFLFAVLGNAWDTLRPPSSR